MDRRLAFLVLAALVLVAGSAIVGCDPKLTGTESDDDDQSVPGDTPDPVVTAEALIVAQIVTLHAEVITNALALAAEFDTATAGPGPRALFTSQCIATAELDDLMPQWSLLMNSCVDGNGTVVTGGGYLQPIENVDGYVFFPYLNDDLIRAINSQDDSYNHTVDNITSGALELRFSRSSGGLVTSVTVGHFIRHFWRSEQITFSYADETTYTGAIGSFSAFPDGGSICRIIWDGVGIFEVNYATAGSATFTLQAVTYQVNLADGSVILAQT